MIGVSVLCSICGKYDILKGSKIESMGELHADYRDHCREVHSNHPEITKDILGREIHYGEFGWTDDYIAVKPFQTEQEITLFEKKIRDLKAGALDYRIADPSSEEEQMK